MEAMISWLERVVLMLVKALSSWTEEEVKLLAARQEEVRAFLRGSTTPAEDRGMDTETQLKRWVRLYHEVFGIELDPSTVRIPERERGSDRLIVIAKGMTPGTIFAVMARLFPSWKYVGDLDLDVISVRTAKDGSYAVWCRDRPEADTENRNQAARAFSQEDCLTLEERLLYEICYFRETGKHLDVESFTICAGSRYRDGDVPRVYRDDDGDVSVYWDDADYRNSESAVRSAVR